MPARTYTFDALWQLANNAQTTGVGQLDAAAKILDIGSGEASTMLVLNVTSLKVSAGDERYLIAVQGSNSPTFASGVENLAFIELGAAAVRAGGAAVSAIGRRFVGIENEVEDTIYRYLRLYNAFTGTSPAITYHAWLSNRAGH